MKHTALIDRASEPYRGAGAFAYNFARGKLRSDPVFCALLERGLLLGRGHILDLGCGQGLLAAWLSPISSAMPRISRPTYVQTPGTDLFVGETQTQLEFWDAVDYSMQSD